MPKNAELAKAATGPLKGVRIVDLTSVVFGAYATQMLADLGADVIKVEFPGGRRGDGGDIMRWAGETPEGAPNDLGPIFMTINRNKRSVLLDLREEKAARALKRLIRTANVFAASVRYEGLKRIGLDYEAVKAVKPDIIYAHAAGYGSSGPYAGEPAYDDMIQSASGMADIIHRADGTEAPRLLPTLAADKISGLFMSQAILAALFHHQRTGEGQFVEIPMLECLTSFNMVEQLYGHVYDPPIDDYGYPRAMNRHRKPFPTKDGYIGVLPYTEEHWVLFLAMGGYRDDPRFVDYKSRFANTTALYQIVEEITRTKTTDEWLALLKPLQIPVVKTNRMEDLMSDPHLEAVGFFERYVHPDAGPYVAMRPPVTYSATPSNIRRHPPRMGQHTDEILAEVGGEDAVD